MLQNSTLSPLLLILGAIVAFLFAALLVVYIIRLVFGRRIKAPGARNRPRRLDVVDTFELDRERQLVIVRRDNVEHLLLLGGPNDILVEGGINRVEAALARPAAEQRAAVAPNWPTPPADAGQQQQPSAPTAEPEPPRRRPVEPALAARDRAPPPPPQGLAPKAPPAGPLPTQLPPDLFAPPGLKPTPAAPVDAPLGAPAAPPPRPAAPLLPPRPPLGGAPGAKAPPPPFLARAQQRLGPAAPTPRPPEPGQRPAAPPPAAPPPPPPSSPVAPTVTAAPPPERPAPPPAEDPLESLEAEMARLLGRDS